MSTATPRFSDEQLGEMLGLMKDADSVELKLTVPDSGHYAAAASLEMDPIDAEIRQVYFFDTPDLRLNGQGVVVRARRVQGKAGDAIVKLRPVVPGDLPRKLRELPGFKVEVDAMPGGYVCSGSLRERVDNSDVREAVVGKRSLSSLFSKDQRAFFSEHTPYGPPLDELSVLGPILILKLKFEPEGFDHRMVAELWMYPDNSRVLELSTKCVPGEAFQVAAESRAFLTDRGVDLSGEQEAKTAKALEYFAAHARPAV